MRLVEYMPRKDVLFLQIIPGDIYLKEVPLPFPLLYSMDYDMFNRVLHECRTTKALQ